MIDRVFLRFPVLRLRAAASAMRIGALLGGLSIYSRLQGWSAVASWSLFGAFVGVITLRRFVDRLQTWSRSLLAKRTQEHFDRRALRCMDAIGRNEDVSSFRPIVLFLRPFAADRNLRFPNRAGTDGFDVMPIESELAKRYNVWCTTIMIGNAAVDRERYWRSAFLLDDSTDPQKLFYVGPGEFHLPASNWLNSVKQIATKADLVFVVPMDFGLSGSKTATFDELDFLFTEHMVDKCIFVMPAEQPIGHVRRVDADGAIRSVEVTEPLAQLWEEGRKRLKRSGVKLPEFVNAPPGFSCFFGWPMGADHPMTMYLLDRSHWPGYSYEWMKRFGKRL